MDYLWYMMLTPDISWSFVMRPTSRPWHRRHRRICMEGKVVQRLDPTDQHSTEELGRPWHKPPITSTCPASFNSWILGLKQFVAHPKQLGKEQSVSFVGPPPKLVFWHLLLKPLFLHNNNSKILPHKSHHLHQCSQLPQHSRQKWSSTHVPYHSPRVSPQGGAHN